MNFSKLLLQRQSVRQYDDRPVERWKLEKLVEAIRLAPSASNSQPWKVIIVDNPALKDRVARATFSKLVRFNRFAPQAAAIAVIVIERPKLITQIGAHLKDREFPLIDIGIGAAQFCLQATELGLGTCMIGWFDEDAVKKLLNIPAKNRVGLLITVGYGLEEERRKVRKKTEQMSSFNSFE